jgi:hypothetical protein
VSIPIGFIVTIGISLTDKKGQAQLGGVAKKATT